MATIYESTETLQTLQTHNEGIQFLLNKVGEHMVKIADLEKQVVVLENLIEGHEANIKLLENKLNELGRML